MTFVLEANSMWQLIAMGSLTWKKAEALPLAG